MTLENIEREEGRGQISPPHSKPEVSVTRPYSVEIFCPLPHCRNDERWRLERIDELLGAAHFHYFCVVNCRVHVRKIPIKVFRRRAVSIDGIRIRGAQTAFILFSTFLDLRPVSDASD
jgi:hypothetical protein